MLLLWRKIMFTNFKIKIKFMGMQGSVPNEFVGCQINDNSEQTVKKTNGEKGGFKDRDVCTLKIEKQNPRFKSQI